jgi:hypothetical protein
VLRSVNTNGVEYLKMIKMDAAEGEGAHVSMVFIFEPSKRRNGVASIDEKKESHGMGRTKGGCVA